MVLGTNVQEEVQRGSDRTPNPSKPYEVSLTGLRTLNCSLSRLHVSGMNELSNLKH